MDATSAAMPMNLFARSEATATGKSTNHAEKARWRNNVTFYPVVPKPDAIAFTVSSNRGVIDSA